MAQQQLHSTSHFQRALDELDVRLGDCDGLLAALSHCHSEARRAPSSGDAKPCREASAAFYACNKEKTRRHTAMRSTCVEATSAFDACMVTNCRQPEACADALAALVTCSEQRGIFAS